MKLDEYVKQTLLDITNGVTMAQEDSKLFIAPGFIENQKVTEPQMVSFEIVVAVSKDAAGGIKVWSIGDVKAQGKVENTNRISFQVPVYFQAPTELNERHFTRQNPGKGKTNNVDELQGVKK